jgi:phosphatidylcholine synthase
MSRNGFLTGCAWAVHLYTAMGAVAGLFAINYIAQSDWRGAFVMMAIAIAIDATDGPLARLIRVRERIPWFDGAMLDNVVDYFTYVAVPVFLMLRARLLPDNTAGKMVAGFVMLASAYGFSRTDAKTDDHYFLGFPSYWNIVALYLFCLGFTPAINAAIVGILALMVFVPIKYIYPNRTEPMRPLTLTLAAVWSVATVAMLPSLPAHNPILLYTSLAFVVYYFVMSVALYAHPTRVAARRARDLKWLN